MTPAEQLQADLKARQADQRRVVDEMLRDAKAHELSPAEKRGIGRLVARVLAFLARFVP